MCRADVEYRKKAHCLVPESVLGPVHLRVAAKARRLAVPPVPSVAQLLATRWTKTTAVADYDYQYEEERQRQEYERQRLEDERRRDRRYDDY